MFKYAGIGSRQTPINIIPIMEQIGEELAKQDWILRSGGAVGADLAFQRGCEVVYPDADDHKEIFWPWRGFSKGDTKYKYTKQEAVLMASKIHPAWNSCSSGAKKLLGRNCHQILGWNLNDPVNLVICWTPSEVRGGTSLGIKLARNNSIPVFNLINTTKEEVLSYAKHLCEGRKEDTTKNRVEY